MIKKQLLKNLLLIFIFTIFFLGFLTVNSYGTVTYTRELMLYETLGRVSSTGGFYITINGLNLDPNRIEVGENAVLGYEVGVAIASTGEPRFPGPATIRDITTNSITLRFSGAVFANEFRYTNALYITIRETSRHGGDNTNIALQSFPVDVTVPLYRMNLFGRSNARVSGTVNARVIQGVNGGTFVFERITDQDIIDNFIQMRNDGVDINVINAMDGLRTTPPSNGWSALIGNIRTIPNEAIPNEGSGLYYIWVRLQDGNSKAIYMRELVDRLPYELATGIHFASENITIEIGQSRSLRGYLRTTPVGAMITAHPTWYSSNESVATVNNSSGQVTGVSDGVVQITARVGNLTATTLVTVGEGGEHNYGTGGNNNNNAGNNNNNNNNNNAGNNNNNNSGGNNTTEDPKRDPNLPPRLPDVGTSVLVIVGLIAVAGVGTIATVKYKKLKDVI